MKLRLRSFESKETIKIEAPNLCSLNQFKQILSQSLPNSPSQASIRLSLNRKNELQSDGENSLQAIGIASGDLIFYSLEPPAACAGSISQSPVFMKTDATPKFDSCDAECSTSLKIQSDLLEPLDSDTIALPSQKRKTLNPGSQVEETVSNMEVDEENTGNNFDGDGVLADAGEKQFSVPGFLRKMFKEQLGTDSGRDHKLIVIAVHAVLLESGFMAFDLVTNVVNEGSNFREDWPSLFKLSLFYTLPVLVNGAQGNKTQCIVLKFQSLGRFINVYGSISGSESGKNAVRSVRLNEDQLVPFLNVVWANCGVTENMGVKDGNVLGTSPEKEVFKFWCTMKDNLALPLLIDICEKAGLTLPPCFMRLPTDLKLKILETVPGVDIAKVICLCSELRYLASNDDLWKLKYAEEFGKDVNELQGSWKKEFARAWELRKNREKFASGHRDWSRMRFGSSAIFPQFPRIIGGEHDLWPGFGNRIPTGWLNDPANRLRRNFSPQCDLGGSGDRGFNFI